MNIVELTWEQTISVRHKVLWPDMPRDFCHIFGDEEAKHFGIKVEGKIVCVASVFIDLDGKSARLRKFATLVEYRHLGYGTLVLEYILQQLPKLGIEYFWCDARKVAKDFYYKFNMEKEGDVFTKSGIEYYKMVRKL